MTEFENSFEGIKSRPVEEIDLTNLELSELQVALTNHIKQGTVIHGSTRSDLLILEPATSHDAFEHKGTETAVFATDQPLIALARGAAGDRIKRWTQQVIFGVDNTQKPFNPQGYIYVLPDSGFIPHPNDPAEYLSANAVRPLARISFNSQAVVPLFRTMEEVAEELDFETGQLKPETIRPTDLLASLLTIRSMVELVGIVDYDFDMESPNGERLIRLRNLGKRLLPIISKLHELANPEQMALAQEIRNTYDTNTISTFELMNVRYTYLLNVCDDIDVIMGKLPLKHD